MSNDPIAAVGREQLMAAMRARHAVRRYTTQPIPDDLKRSLRAATADFNAQSGLAIQVFFDEPAGFSGFLAHYGSFREVRNYIAVVGATGTIVDEACGYWGEHLVLLAQSLGLNSCWVGLTYSKSKNQAVVGHDEKLRVMIALGYGVDAGKPSKSKPLDQLGRVVGGGGWPSWFTDGVAAAALAPTGLNKQGFLFELDGDVVSARSGNGSYSRVDLGIAKYHFELGAGLDGWHWA